MLDISIPIPLSGLETAEIKIFLAEKRKEYWYRLESYHWNSNTEKLIFSKELGAPVDKVSWLKALIKNYDPEWEIIQILNSNSDAGYIQILYRKKKVSTIY